MAITEFKKEESKRMKAATTLIALKIFIKMKNQKNINQPLENTKLTKNNKNMKSKGAKTKK